MRKFLTYLLITFCSLNLFAEDKKLQALIEKRCVDCHDQDINEGNVRFDQDIFGDHELLEKAFLQVRSGDMPPPKKNKMTDSERSEMVEALTQHIYHTDKVKRKRLTKLEFVNTLSDLLDFEIQSSWVAELPEDSGKDEFNTMGNLGFSEIHLQLYLNAIDSIVEKALNSTKPESKEFLSKKFTYEKHARRPRIQTDGPNTIIKGQPRTAKGLSFPYFREDFKCRQDGYYDISYTAKSAKGATVLVFAGPYYKDGALVNKEPRTIDIAEIKKKRTHTFRVYLKKGNELGFSTLAGRQVIIDNPVKITGPLTKEWPPKRVSTLFPGVRVQATKSSFKLSGTNQQLKLAIKQFAQRAFRKNVNEESLKAYYELAENYFDANGNFLMAAKETFKTILSSPNFLYHDLSRKDNSTYASRLSYFLWRSTPDTKLLQSAYNGKVSGELDRLMSSSKVDRFMKDFTTQWLRLDNLRKVSPDFRLYPEFDTLLNQSMPKESIAFMKHLYEKDLPIQNIIDSDFLVVNNQLAKHYKIPGIVGPELRIITNSTKERGGLLTQAGIMMTTADGASTTPIKRGVWLSEHILGKTIPQPPIEVAGIEPDLNSKATIIEQLDKHRDNKACRSCHMRIDPYGVAFESFDPIGQYRENYRVLGKKSRAVITYNPRGAYQKGAKVETVYNMADGTEYKGIRDFKKILLNEQEVVHRAFVQKLYMFAIGRELTPEEVLESDQFSKTHLKSGFKTLVKELTLTQLFRGQK